MKQYRFHLLLIILFFYNNCFSQCDQGTLNLGTVDSSWIYKNKSIKISFQLPQGWYMYDQVATDKKYLKIGSDYRKMSEVLFAGGAGPEIDMAQVKTLPFEYALTLLSLAKLDDTIAVIPADNEKKQNSTISFRAYYADTTDADHFLKIIYKKVTKRNDGMPEIKEGKLGELDYKYILLSFSNKSGAIENWIYGVRNFGCIHVVIRMIYISEADLSQIIEACGQLKMEK